MKTVDSLKNFVEFYLLTKSAFIKHSKQILIRKIGEMTLANFISYNFLLFFPLFLMQAWFVQYFNSGAPFDYVARLSFIISDIPWMPPGTEAKPLLGSHYFGDLLINIAYGNINNPYDGTLHLPSQTPPIGLLFFQIFEILGEKYILALFLFISSISFLYIFINLRSKGSNFRDNSLLFLLVITSYPLLIEIDRGSVYLICLALLLFAFMKYDEDKVFLPMLIGVLACSIKPHLVLIIALFLVLVKRIKYLIIFSFALGIMNLVSLVIFFEGKLYNQVTDYIQASGRYMGEPGSNLNEFFIGLIANSSSLVGMIGKIIGNVYGPEIQISLLTQYSTYLYVPGMIYLFIVVVIVKSKIVENWLKFGFVFSMCSFFVPASGPYSLLWTIPAILILGESSDLSNKFNRITGIGKVQHKLFTDKWLINLAKVIYLYGIFFSSIFHIWSIEGCCGSEYFPFGEFAGTLLILISAAIFFSHVCIVKFYRLRIK